MRVASHTQFTDKLHSETQTRAAHRDQMTPERECPESGRRVQRAAHSATHYARFGSNVHDITTNHYMTSSKTDGDGRI